MLGRRRACEDVEALQDRRAYPRRAGDEDHREQAYIVYTCRRLIDLSLIAGDEDHREQKCKRWIFQQAAARLRPVRSADPWRARPGVGRGGRAAASGGDVEDPG